ncbi:MAG: hypothetical protein JJE09_14940 [Bacteroidia bacterium]|nr:hypothetical protein [Bacteroidia bacterium]
MKNLLLTAVLAIIFQFSFGQSDFVITIKGDTLYGKAQILSYDIVDRVQITIDKKKKSLTALEAKAVFLNNEMYYSVRYDTRYKFMIQEQSGYLSLYRFRIDKQFRYDGRYLVKRDGNAIEVPNLTFKKTMQEFLKDCSAVSDKIKSGELGRNHLDTLITLYNNCIDQNTAQALQTSLSTVESEASLMTVEILQKKIEASTISSKLDVLDLLNDIVAKVKSNQTVPNYLTDGLKGYLSDTEYSEDLEKLVAALQKK